MHHTTAGYFSMLNFFHTRRSVLLEIPTEMPEMLSIVERVPRIASPLHFELRSRPKCVSIYLFFFSQIIQLDQSSIKLDLYRSVFRIDSDVVDSAVVIQPPRLNKSKSVS